jgi:hypothetical protein
MRFVWQARPAFRSGRAPLWGAAAAAPSRAPAQDSAPFADWTSFVSSNGATNARRGVGDRRSDCGPRPSRGTGAPQGQRDRDNVVDRRGPGGDSFKDKYAAYAHVGLVV